MDENQFPQQGEQPADQNTPFQPGNDPDGQQFDPNTQQTDPFAQYQDDPFAKFDQGSAPADQNSQQPQPDPVQEYSQKPSETRVTSLDIVNMIKADPIRLCAYIGYLFIILASWIPRWAYIKVSFFGVSTSEGFGLFSSGGGILKLYGFLFILFGLVGSLIEFGSYIPALNKAADKFKTLPFSQFYIPCAAFIVWLLAIFNSNFRDVINSAKQYEGMLNDAASAGYGFAMWMCLIGIILVLIRPILALVQNKSYWEE